MYWWYFFYTIGLLAFLNYLYDVLKSPVQLMYHKWLNILGKDVPLIERYGQWAAITGSTDGIGKAYARHLVNLGFNIVLIARNENKLKMVAQEIEQEFGVEVFIVKTDFSQGSQIFEKLFQDLAKRPIRLLVNNVGVSPGYPGPVFTSSSEKLWHVINVNIGAATQLCRHFVDHWYRTGQKGCIVNISSGLEVQPCPNGAVYAASKAYIRSFTLALQHEVEPLGITVQLVSPNLVATKINSYSSSIMKGSLMIPTADEYAQSAVKTIGKTTVTTGYVWHAIQNTIGHMLPWRLRTIGLNIMIPLIADDFKRNYVINKN